MESNYEFFGRYKGKTIYYNTKTNDFAEEFDQRYLGTIEDKNLLEILQKELKGRAIKGEGRNGKGINE